MVKIKKACAVFIIILASFSAGYAKVLLGLDVLEEEKFVLLKGKRVGLICNVSSVNSAGVPCYEAFRKGRVSLTALFAPEHGLFANEDAGKSVDSMTWKGIPVYSLYGKTQAPTSKMLAGIDVLVFDIQDAGVRVFTYISTMRLAMKAAANEGKAFVVLERPNPIGYYPPQGFVLDTALRSFVGAVPVPYVHGLTIGEVATLIQKSETPALTLSVVGMKGYNKHSFYNELGLKLVPPSPNLATMDALICYPATVLFEPTNITEGRGTDKPFEKIGAPYINPHELIKALPTDCMAGYEPVPITFTPVPIKGKAASPKYQGKACSGLYLKITDRKKIKPFAVAVALLVTLKKLYPKDFVITSPDFFDKLAGTYKLRQMLEAGSTAEDIIKIAK